MVDLTGDRLAPFLSWRDAILGADHLKWAQLAYQRNNWFTPENTLKAIAGVLRYFERIEEFAYRYPQNLSPKKIGVVMAGNVPLVGFQDALLVLLAGHRLVAKLSTNDDFLLKAVLSLYPKQNYEFAEMLKGCDAYIATGSDNAARYFEYYFGKYPHIIRKNRTSVAVLDGSETDEELLLLSDDMLDYFGLGCRSVSSLWLPEGYNIQKLLTQLEPKASDCMNNHKYANNYQYQKTCLLLSNAAHLDNGAILFKESEALSSPVAMVHYRFYKSEQDVLQWLGDQSDKIQCVIGKKFLPFGCGQKPDIFFCADQIDTMQFLVDLK